MPPFRSLVPPGTLLSAIQLSLESMVVAAQPPGNRLVREKSPYLQQHAHNPIDWYPWGEEAFAEARRQNKLIFLSIGYSTCHWCHVMERESFADREVAAALNRDFIAIKVDREERPDIDSLYMQVCTAITGSGGWPLTLLMTPDKFPVFAGTYLPKERRYQQPGLLDLLPRAATAWAENPQGLREGGSSLLQKLARQTDRSGQQAAFAPELLQRAVDTLRDSFDRQHGGFGDAPKFPRPHTLSFLLHRYVKTQQTELLEMINVTLRNMRQGGLYDHLGFGFHRYATDREWLVPHFEKMLYDQAGLARTYLEAWQLTGHREYAETARDVFRYVLRELHNPQGGFYSAEDADSEGEEGRFYVWRRQDILGLLGEKRGDCYARIYQVATSGNYLPEGSEDLTGDNILHLKKPLGDWATELGRPLRELQQELEDGRQRLFQARERRPRPFRDDKIITAWNGLMISSLALGGRLLDEPAFLHAAESAASFILNHMRDATGTLLRRWRQGEAAIPAFAEDYGFLAQGLLDLYRSTFDPHQLAHAVTLAEQLDAKFSDDHGRIYDTTAGSELPIRTGELYDGAIPSAGSVALTLYARLYHLTGQPRWQERAQALLGLTTAEVSRYPAGYTQLLIGAGLLLEPGRGVVIVGLRDADDTRALLEVVRTISDPELSVLLRPVDAPGIIDRLVPFAGSMPLREQRATAYLCQDFSCREPVTRPEDLLALLQSG